MKPSSPLVFVGRLLLLAGILALPACTPSAPGVSGGTGRAGETQKPARVTIGIWNELKALAPKFAEGGGTFANDFSFIVNSPLAAFDNQGAVHPRLALEIPTQERGTWTVSADGRMATTWKIRPNALWHDGQPVTSRDFVFAHRTYRDPELVRSIGEPERYMERVEASDDKTFTIHWAQPYPRADQMIPRRFDALPAHLLEALYDSDKAAFQTSSFFTSESYVGNGPYALTQWDKGSQLIFKAFDRYFLGRPKLDEVVIRITSDPNTIVAYVLTGEVDLTVDTTLNQQGRVIVQQEWSRTGGGQVFQTPTYMRATEFQLNPDRMSQASLLDPRVRRALVHALDRATIADVVSEGSSPVADVAMHPGDPLFPRVDQVIGKYPYDPQRALALLQEAGWTRGSLGRLTSAAGDRFELDVWTTEMADNIIELRIIADYWNSIGIEVSQTPIPQARNRELGFRSSFTGMTITGHAIDPPWSIDKTSDRCPLPPAFSGGNRGCWSNPEFDAAARVAITTLNKQEQTNALVQMFRIITTEVPFFGMSYHMDNTPVRKGLAGPGPRWPGQNGNTWNIHEWEWRAN